MNTCSTMYAFVKAVEEKFGVDLSQPGAHITINRGSYMPLTIERVFSTTLAISHHYIQNGDVMYDPEVVFFTGYDGEFVPTEFTQHPYVYQEVAELSEDLKSVARYNPKQMRSVARFAEMWAKNLNDQGFLNGTKEE